jgi:Uma2 family endonuclease
MGRRIERRSPATYADVAAAPEHVIAELIGGVLYTSPRPSPRHALASLRLGAALDGPFGRGQGGPGGWTVLIEPELHLAGGDVLVPDLAGWRRERLPVLPDKPAIDVAPEWVCEVLSPSNKSHDRKHKLPKYAASAVPWLWLVDPEERMLEGYQLDGDRWAMVGVFEEEDVAVRAPPFEAVELDLSALWADPAQRASE